MKICHKLGHQYEATKRQCPVCKAESSRKWKAVNKAQEVENQRRWQAENKEQHTENKRLYKRQRRADDPLFKLTCDIRNLINCAFKRQGFNKSSKTASVLGCDFKTLEIHLIQTTIENYGYWTDFQDYHIDHIIPLSEADGDEAKLLALNHHSNLQLLYPRHNLAKGDRLDFNLREYMIANGEIKA